MDGTATLSRDERTEGLEDSILETANEAFIGIDGDGIIRRWNRAAERILGWPREEVIGRPLLDTVVPPRLRDELVNALARYLRTGERHLLGNRLERSALRRDGAEIPIELSSAATGTGAETIFYAFIHDISERKEFERSVERAARQVEVSHELIGTLSADMRIHDANGRWLEVLGWRPDELRDEPVLEWIHPADRDATVAEVATALEGGRPTGFRNRIRARDGAWHWIEWSAVALSQQDLAYVAGRDVTERMSAEKRLRDAARHFELTHDLVCTTTRDGFFDELNGRWQETLGWTRDELRRPFIELVHPDDRETTRRRFASIARGEAADGFVNRYRAKDGTWRWLEWSAAMDFDEDRVYASARDVTERIEADKRLKEAARHFDLSHDLVCTAKPDGTFLAMNGRWEAMLGWKPEELRAGSLAAFIHPEDLAATAEVINGVVGGEDTSEFVNRFRAKDGGWHWLEWTGVSEPDKEVVYASARDVTDRIEAELAYGQLGAIVESSGDAIYGYTLDGVITSWNRAAEQLLGYPPAQAIGMPLSELVPPDRPDDSHSILARIAADEVVQDRQSVRLGRDGEHVDVSLTVSPVRDAAGRIIGASSIARDIRGRLRVWRRTRAHHRATSVLANAPDPPTLGAELLPILSACDGWSHAAYWNRADDSDRFRCDATWMAPRPGGPLSPVSRGDCWEPGGDPDDSLSEPTWESVHDAAVLTPGLASAQAAGLRTVVWIPISSYGRVVGGFELLARGRRRTDRELLDALASIASQASHYVERRQAEHEAARLKNEFFSLISHELRTPLTSIIGYTEVLEELDAKALSERGRKSLEVVHRNARRELQLVTDLLTLVHIESGTFSVDPQPMDLKQVALEAVDAAEPIARRHGVRLELHSEEPLEIEADPQRIGQVLDNLLSNAIKFSPDGGEVRVCLAAGDGDVSIEVRDTGMGIPPEDLDRLFERLFRASGATAMRIPGTGLGLTIVKAILDAHGGHIEVESEEGAGTTFRLEIPIHAMTPAHDEMKEVAR